MNEAPPRSCLGPPPEDSALGSSGGVVLPVPCQATTICLGGTRGRKR